jgi:glycosyltransferase involved in cell wall biosynthesis
MTRRAPRPHPEDDDLIADERPGLVRLHGPGPRNGRRVLLVQSYGMAGAWQRRMHEAYPSQHLWGCLELARRGWEVLLPEPPPPVSLAARRRTAERRALGIALRHLRHGDVLYGTVGPWIARLRRARLLRCATIALHHAGPVPPHTAHADAVVAIVPASARKARAVFSGPVARIDWGVELPFYQTAHYRPRFALAVGKSFRDFDTLARAFADAPLPLRLIVPNDRVLPPLPPAVEVTSGGPGDQSVSYEVLRDVFYRHAAVALLVLKPEPQGEPVGLTSLLEAMALARPVVVTRTPILQELLDVEKEGIGLYVEPGDALGLRKAVQGLVDDPARAAEMGRRGRVLVERHFHLERMATELDELFRRVA